MLPVVLDLNLLIMFALILTSVSQGFLLLNFYRVFISNEIWRESNFFKPLRQRGLHTCEKICRNCASVDCGGYECFDSVSCDGVNCGQGTCHEGQCTCASGYTVQAETCTVTNFDGLSHRECSVTPTCVESKSLSLMLHNLFLLSLNLNQLPFSLNASFI